MQHPCYIDAVKALRQPASPLLLAAIVVGFVASLGGTYWDAGWHTVRGRDSFLSPPHVLLYAGVGLLGAAFVGRAAALARVGGWRRVAAEPSVALGVIGAGITLTGAPIDDFWHEMFGRDSVIWSPPHMLGVVGTLALASAFLLEIGRAGGRVEQLFQPVAGAALLAAALVPVLEYDLDVPQYSVVFYMPVVATGAAFAFALISQGRAVAFAATRSTVAYTAVIAALGAVLGAFDYPAPMLPLLLPVALGFDLLVSAGRHPVAAGGAVIGLGTVGVYLPLRALAGDGLGLTAPELAASAGLALAGASAALAAGWGGIPLPRLRPRPLMTSVFIAVTGISMLVPAQGSAHDPGQGPEAGTASLAAVANERSLRLDADMGGVRGCEELRPVRLRARRAGEEVGAPLRPAGTCRARGTVEVPTDGRWFVYAEFERDGQQLETWLPLEAGASEASDDRSRLVYAPRTTETTAPKIVAGVIVYGLLVLVMLSVGRRVRAAASPAPGGTAQPTRA